MTHSILGRMNAHAHERNLFASLAVIFMILTLVLAACGGSGTSTTSQIKTGGNISVGLAADAVTLDPLMSTALYDRQVMLNIYDTLVSVNQQNNIVPDLATSWTYATPTQLVFTLRTDVKFQDGTPFNADAVVVNINRILSTPSSPRNTELATVKSVQAVDTSHVAFMLTKPFSPLLATLSDRAGIIISPTALRTLGANLAHAPVNAGSGPFMFSEWVNGDHLTIKKNPHYWQKDAQGNALPYLDSIKYRPITNGTLEFSNLQTGSINVADTVDPNDVATAKSSANLVYKQIPGLSFNGFYLNTKVAPLDNVLVRQAIAWAVNRQEILSGALKGIGVVANGPIPPSSWAYDKNFTPYTYDLNKAKAALAQAGKSDGVSFSLSIASGSPLNTLEAQFIQAELQRAGITVNIKQETFATLLSDTTAHNFQAALLGWSGRPDPDGNIYSFFHTGGGNNDMQYSNKQVDTLLEGARASSDQNTRKSDYQQAEQIIMQDSPYIFINYGVSVQATSTSIQNFTLLPTTIMIFTHVSLGS